MTAKLLWVCDIQSKLVPVLYDHIIAEERMLQCLKLAVDAAVKSPQEWGVLVTEQVPSKLGHTIPAALELVKRISPHSVKEKTKFSGADAIIEFCKEHDCRFTELIILGAEAHICVLKTVMDLLGKADHSFDQITVLEDGIYSMSPKHRTIALEALHDLDAKVRVASRSQLQAGWGGPPGKGYKASWIDSPERLCVFMDNGDAAGALKYVIQSFCKLHGIPLLEASQLKPQQDRDVLVVCGRGPALEKYWKEVAVISDCGATVPAGVHALPLSLESLMYLVVPCATDPKFKPTLQLVKQCKISTVL